MKILYLSSHSILEYDEVCLLTELYAGLNIEVFSMGAFSNPTQSGDFMRSVIPNGKFYPNLYGIAMQCDKALLHPELVDWADIIISMHNSAVPGQKLRQPWIGNNLKLFKEKNKRVIWRSIGQSTPEIEKEMKGYRDQGVQILRYSPLEEKIPNYAGHDAIIRFAKDADEFTGWIGDKKHVITFVQSFKKRGSHVGYSVFEDVTSGFSRKVFGTENEDLGEIGGGLRTYRELKEELKRARVYFYYGTQPAPYTLSFIEALMTGIPIVAVGKVLRQDDKRPYNWPAYEIPDIIQNGVNGFVSDNVEELRGYIQLLLDDSDRAKAIGDAGRRTALKLFSKKQIMNEWEVFLNKG